MFRLRDDQLADVARVLAEPSKAALIGTTVGGGKTAVAVELVRQSGAKVTLAVVPPNTYRGWRRHVKMMLGQDVRLTSSKKKEEQNNVLRLRAGEPGFYMMSWEFARQFDLTEPPIDFVIGDEAHRAQNRKSNSFGMFSDLCKAVQARGGWRIAMSATPYGNRPAGAFGVTHSLWPKRFHHFWPFVEEFIGKQLNVWSGTYEPKVTEREPGIIARAMPCYIRHQPNVACCEFHPKGLQFDLPKRVVHQVDVELSAAQRKIYNTIERENFVWLEGSPNPLTTQGFPIVLSARLRQICLGVPTTELATRINSKGEAVDYTKLTYPIDAKSTKIDAVLDILADIPDGARLLLLSHSAGIGEAIAHRINKAKLGPAKVWNGSVSAQARHEIFSGFLYGETVPVGDLHPTAEEMRPWDKPDDCRVIVAQVGAIGEGVDGLQWVCSNEIWFSLDTNNLLNIQAAGRLVRDGQLNPVNSWSLEAVDTVEQDQLESLEFQNTVMSAALSPLTDQ